MNPYSGMLSKSLEPLSTSMHLSSSISLPSRYALHLAPVIAIFASFLKIIEKLPAITSIAGASIIFLTSLFAAKKLFISRAPEEGIPYLLPPTLPLSCMVENMPGNSTSATLPLFSSDKPYSITWLYQRWRLSVYIKRLLLQSPYYPPSSWTIYSVESSLFPCQSHGACMNQSSGYLQPLNPYSLVDISQIHKTWRKTEHVACVYC